MKKINKLCKKFHQNDNFQVSLQEDQKNSTPTQSPQQKQTQIIVDQDINKQNTEEQIQQVDFFENCSQYSDSVLSDIENSVPSKKKKVLKSIDVLQITDSDNANQKSQATKSDKNNSYTHQGNGKYMSYAKNEQIFENEEENDEYDDEKDYQMHKKILQENNDISQFRDKSYSTPIYVNKKQNNTVESQSYYNTTIDLAQNS